MIRSLNKKGCNITTANAITKEVEYKKFPDVEEINSKFAKFIESQDAGEITTDVYLLGELEATNKWFGLFKESNHKLFSPINIKKTIVIQAPYTVNVSDAHDLGNGSWGKIDFLTNHKGFSVSGVVR